jgi:transposase
MIASIRLDGSTAWMTICGATDTEVFRAYVAEVLLPTLQPGDLVVMDNLAEHKSEPTLQLLTQAGAQVLFLPACAADLNSIEKMWSKVKKRPAPDRSTHLRGSAHRRSAPLSLESPPTTPSAGSSPAAIAFVESL